MVVAKRRGAVPLNALRTFEAAARSLSFQEAATELFVTPAAVSHQIKRLEAYLGTPLFVRGHRAIALTDEGELLAGSLGEVFGLLDVAVDRALAPHSADLRVSTVESFAAKWLAPRLHRFHREFPEVRVRIETGDQPADLARGGVDVAIRYGAGRYTGVRVEHLMEAPAFPVCAPGLPALLRRRLLRPADLRHFVLLHDESASARPGVPDWAAWLAAAGAEQVDARRGPVFGSIYLAQEAAMAAHGVALGLGPLVEEDLRRGRLVRPFELSLANRYAFWVVTRERSRPSKVVDAFRRWLQAEASAQRS